MNNIKDVFQRDIKRKFSDVATVDKNIRAMDIAEYVITKNVADIFGNFLAYFFDDPEQYPNLKMKCSLMQNMYREPVGPGVWIRGFFGSGKSHLLKILNTIFSRKTIPYKDENGNRKELDIIKTIQSTPGINSDLAELIGNINSDDYLTFIFSANHLSKMGETIIDLLPRVIGEEIYGEKFVSDQNNYSAKEVSDLLLQWLDESGKKRMIVFIDEILDLLDNDEKVRKFEGLIELLDNRIWFVVTSLVAKNQLLNPNTAERMKDRFGKELILKSEEMLRVVKNRYLLKKADAIKKIESSVSIPKLEYHFANAYAVKSEDGRFTSPNIIASYPFYPFQLAYLKEVLKNEEKGSSRNLMKLVKSIIKDPNIYNKEIGYFIDTELIYNELSRKKGVEDEYGELIEKLENNRISNNQGGYVDEKKLMKILKALVLIAQVLPEGCKADMILPFVFSDEINDLNQLKDYLDILAEENYITNEGGIYKPITRKEGDVWSKIRDINSIQESEVRENIRDRIYRLMNTETRANKNILKGTINGFEKNIAFVLKSADKSSEYPNVFSCIPINQEIRKLETQISNSSMDKEKLFIVPKNIDGERLLKATKFYLQMDEALNRASDFGIDQDLQIQIENKRDLSVNQDIDRIIEKAFQESTIIYLGNKYQDFSEDIKNRIENVMETMLKQLYPDFFGELLRERVDTFIKNEILSPTHKLVSPYLKKLDLIDNQGAIKTNNRFYNKFIHSFPSKGFARDGKSILEDFSGGQFGWDLDIIKIMTALAFKQEDIKISKEGKTYILPTDLDELVGSEGPFTSRKRTAFENYQFAVVNISDAEISKSIQIMKNIDPSITVKHQLKDVADKIKNYFDRVFISKLEKIKNEYDKFLDPEKIESLEIIINDFSSILKKTDYEDIVKIFNSKFFDNDKIDLLAELIQLIRELNKLDKLKKIYIIFENAGDKTKQNEIKKIIVNYIAGDNAQYDEAGKIYKIRYQEKYREYDDKYNSIINEIKSISEWKELTEEEQSVVISGLDFKRIDNFNFVDELITEEIGDYASLTRVLNSLEQKKEKQIEKLFNFYEKGKTQIKNDQGPIKNSGNNQYNQNKDTKNQIKETKRINKSIKEYANIPSIYIDSDIKLKELEEIYKKMIDDIKQQLDNGNTIRLDF